MATGGRIPRRRPEPSGRYLSLEERLQIADLYLGGAGVRAIAVGIGRSPATVSRELRRNGSAPTARRAGKYAPYAAQKQAELRGRRPKASKFDHAELATVVQSRLCVKWSPEQISLHLAETFPERAEMRVCPETIYQALYVQGRGHLRADRHRHLRTGRAVRRPRGSSVTKRGKIPNMILIWGAGWGWAAGHPFAAAGGGMMGFAVSTGRRGQSGGDHAKVLGVMTCTTRADQG
jgi:IS30 family transposase